MMMRMIINYEKNVDDEILDKKIVKESGSVYANKNRGMGGEKDGRRKKRNNVLRSIRKSKIEKEEGAKHRLTRRISSANVTNSCIVGTFIAAAIVRVRCILLLYTIVNTNCYSIFIIHVPRL